MTTITTDAILGCAVPHDGRRPLSLGYLGVLALWAAVCAVNPPLGWRLFQRRRADSPIPRRRR